jgi:K+-transporting ATPase ATPase A chain
MMNAVLLVAIIVGGTAILSWPLGRYMKWAMDPDLPPGGPVGWTRAFQWIGGPLTRTSHNWKQYMVAMLLFNAVMFTVTFSILALQQYLPLNPDGMGPVEGSLIFNTTASFTSNTNLQHYSGESTLSYLSQLGGLMWLQFVSAATGIAALAALARGLAGRETMGNFFVDLQRASFLVLLPVALIVASLMVIWGMPMTLEGAAQATALEGAEQTIARGPVAAFLTIKQLGTNGGGFFGPNSTHPFENPNFWTNGLAMISIILIPMACVWMFGRIVGRMRHATVVLASLRQTARKP